MGNPRKEASQIFMLFITWRCNGKCPGCIVEKMHGRKKDMSIRTTRRVVGNIGSFHEVAIAGGEPTMHPRFWQMVGQILAKKPQKLNVVTNGISFSGSESAASKWFSRWGRLAANAAKSNTHLSLQVSVGDSHAAGLRGGQAEMRQRIRNIKQALPKGRDFAFNFIGEHMPRQSPAAVISKYALPKRTPVRSWEPGAVGGTAPETVVDPRGRVFETEADLVFGRNPIGNIGKEQFHKINARRARHR